METLEIEWYEAAMNNDISTIKQNTTKSGAYDMEYNNIDIT